MVCQLSPVGLSVAAAAQDVEGQGVGRLHAAAAVQMQDADPGAVQQALVVDERGLQLLRGVAEDWAGTFY